MKTDNALGGVEPSTGRRVYELRFDKGTSTGSLIRQGAVNDMEMLDFAAAKDQLPQLTTHQRDLFQARASVVEATQAVLDFIYHVQAGILSQLPWDSNAQSWILTLVEVADFYDCTSVLKGHLRNYFQDHAVPVGMQCRRDPIGMLTFATKVESDLVAMECCTWLVAQNDEQWMSTLPRLKALGDISIGIIETRREIELEIKEVDLELFRILPPVQERYRRTLHSDQAAISYFRQWLADKKGNSDLGPNYAKLYRDIAHGNVAGQATRSDLFYYLDENDDAAYVDEVRTSLSRILEEACEIVRPLLRDVSKCTTIGDAPEVLRIMTVSSFDLPWNKKR